MRTLVVLSFVTGCGISQPALTPTQQAELDRETTLDDMPKGNATMGDGVVRVIVSSTHTANGHICSGSLVDRSMVLTAAHCLEDADAGSVRVELGGEHLPWGRVGAKRVRTCDDHSIDLAAIVISKPVPLDVPILGMHGTTASLSLNAPVSRVGFGTGMKVWSIPAPGEGVAPIIQASRKTSHGSVVWASDTMVATTVDASYGDSGGPILAADGSILAVATAVAEMPDDDRRVTLGVAPDACPSLFEATFASR